MEAIEDFPEPCHRASVVGTHVVDNRDALSTTIRSYPENDHSFAGHLAHPLRMASSL
jgi:hypothetical protein